MKIPNELGVLESGKKLLLPDAAATQGFALLATRGAGKTASAGVMEEIMCKLGIPWCAFDPPDHHWGINYEDADGKPAAASGLDVLVVGGKYGHVPLDDHAGALLAETIVEANISCVVELRSAGFAARKRFIAAFANRLFEINELPRHIFLDEAQEFVPQQLRYDEQKEVFAALERIIQGGRGQGLGFTLISHRPQSIAKSVLELIDNLIVLRMRGPKGIAAVKEWIETNITDPEAIKAILNTMPRLKDGEAWLLSPFWMEEVTRFKMRRRVTYHAGRTPKVGEKVVAPKKLDLSAVVAKFEKAAAQRQFVIQQEVDLKAENTDLKKRIKQLERQAEKAAPAAGVSEREVARQVREAVASTEAQVTASGASMKMLQRLGAKAMPLLQELVEGIDKATADIGKVASNGRAPARTVRPERPGPGGDVSRKPAPVSAATHRDGTEPHAPPDRRQAEGGPISRRQQRILDALAEFESVGLDSVHRSAVAARSGASPKSSAYSNNLGALRSAGLIAYPGSNLVALTNEGRNLAGAVGSPPTLADLHAGWRGLLSQPQVRIIDVLLDRYPNAVEREELADLAGASSISSAYSNNLGRMRTLGVIDYPASGMVAATELLFPPGL